MRRLAPSRCLLLASILPAPLWAQELEEVVVTAQRREQSLQEVPFSVTAFTGSVIENTNIRGAVDYLTLTPNVSFTEDGQVGSRGLGIAVRGIKNLVSGENAVVNSIGIYLDEFSVASIPSQVANPFIPDMARVEVLRGPHGTYFGRNSLGGAINLTTARPANEFGGKVLLGGEKYENAGEQFSMTGIVNVPIFDNVNARAVGFYEESSGLVRNICAAGASSAECPIAAANNFVPTGARNSGHDYFMGRLKVQWDISADTNARLTIIYADEKQGHDENVPSGFLDLDTVNTFLIEQATDSGTGFWPKNRNRLSHDRPEETNLKTRLGILNIRHQLIPGLILKSITGILDAKLQRLLDQDLVGGADIVVRENLYKGLSWSTELRLDASYESLDWTIGLLYAEDEITQENNVATGVGLTAGHDLDPPNGLVVLPAFRPGLGLGFNHKSFDVRSIAVFADTTYHLTEYLSLIAGGRYTHDRVDTVLEAFGLRPTCCFPFTTEFPGPPGPQFFASFINVINPSAIGRQTFDDVSPRFGFRYAIAEDVGVYGLLSKGYKAGGTSLGNAPVIGAPAFNRPFKAETLWNYELGLKSEGFDRRLRVNGAIFYLRWRDMQFEAQRALGTGLAAPIVEQTINITSAEGLGGEIEILALPTARLNISAALGYLDTRINSDEVIVLTGEFPVNLKGLRLPKAPELTANAAVEYHWPMGVNDAWLRLEYSYRQGQYSDIEALTNLQTRGSAPRTGLVRPVGPDEFPFRTPDYDLINVRAGYDTDRWRIIVYAQNLADEKYFTGTQENFGTGGIRLRPHPRVFGASLSYTFGGID